MVKIKKIVKESQYIVFANIVDVLQSLKTGLETPNINNYISNYDLIINNGIKSKLSPLELVLYLRVFSLYS